MAYLTTAQSATTGLTRSLADEYGPPRLSKAARMTGVTLDLVKAARRDYETSPSADRRQFAYDYLRNYDAAMSGRPDWMDDVARPAVVNKSACPVHGPYAAKITGSPLLAKVAGIAPGEDPEEVRDSIRLLDHPSARMRAYAERDLDRRNVRLGDAYRLLGELR